MDTDPTKRRNIQAAEQVIEACRVAGIDHFFLAPGSRCTPLTLAIANRSDVQVIKHFDERALAFACLGYARSTGRCGVLVCTSGTAVANLLPAVVEAFQDHVPMLLLTADRPPELRDIGSNQSIDQINIFGKFVRYSLDLPCPDDELPTGFWRTSVERALEHSEMGPTQLNCAYREPFGAPDSAQLSPVSLKDVHATHPTNFPLSKWPSIPAWRLPEGSTFVIAGSCTRSDALAAQRLARQLRAPFFSDISNGVRGDVSALQLVRADNPLPDVVVHVGQRVVTKRWWSFMEQNPPKHYIHLTRYTSPFDPGRCITATIRGELGQLCESAVVSSQNTHAFTTKWLDNHQLTLNKVSQMLGDHSSLSEPQAICLLAELIPPDSGLFLGNSLPIREWDSFTHWTKDRALHVGCNRGASGIDGLLATSIGFARGLGRFTTCVLGDLSTLHDLNSLALLAQSPIPMVLVIINNDGGGIFHFLPIANETPHFESYFATPHGIRFEDAARMFGIPYERVHQGEQLTSVYRNAIASARTQLVEITTDRTTNHKLQQSIEAAIREASS